MHETYTDQQLFEQQALKTMLHDNEFGVEIVGMVIQYLAQGYVTYDSAAMMLHDVMNQHMDDTNHN